jgi:hypothetical protein
MPTKEKADNEAGAIHEHNWATKNVTKGHDAPVGMARIAPVTASVQTPTTERGSKRR